MSGSKVVRYQLRKTLGRDRRLIGYSLVGYSRTGRVVNAINGGKTDTMADMLRAAHRAWPSARIMKKPRRLLHRMTR